MLRLFHGQFFLLLEDFEDALEDLGESWHLVSSYGADQWILEEENCLLLEMGELLDEGLELIDHEKAAL